MVYLPGVTLQTRENVTLSAPGAASVIALLGTAQWGEMNSIRSFTSFSQVLDYFKEDKADLTIIKAAELAYQNGATQVKVVRIGDGDEAKAEKSFNSGVTPVLKFAATFEGSYGNNVFVTITTIGSNRAVEITDGQTTESFTNAGNGYADNDAIVAAINDASEGSSLVSASKLDTTLVDAASQTALAGGDDGHDSLIASDFTTAFDNVLVSEDWDILLIPGQTDDSFHTTMVSKLNARASTEKKYSVFFSGADANETIATIQARSASGKRLSLVAPSIKYTLRYSGAESVLDGSFLACAYAGVVAAQDIEVAPTRKEMAAEGLSVDSATGKEYYNTTEMEQLLSYGVVPVSRIEGSLKVARGVTRTSDKTSIYFEQNIVRIVDFISGEVQSRMDGFLGDPNLERIRKVMALEVDGILQQARLDEVIVGYQPTEVAVGGSPDTVLVNLAIQPTFAINFISITLAINR